METITDLIKHVPVPKMVKIRECFDESHIPTEEIAETVRRELDREEIGGKIKPGQRIAITCGSRGINHYALMARAIVDFVKSKGAEPYIVAAMGSHGGATAEGQTQILQDYGITEEDMGCSVKSSMETVQIGISEVRGSSPCSWTRTPLRRTVSSCSTVSSLIPPSAAPMRAA